MHKGGEVLGERWNDKYTFWVKKTHQNQKWNAKSILQKRLNLHVIIFLSTRVVLWSPLDRNREKNKIYFR